MTEEEKNSMFDEELTAIIEGRVLYISDDVTAKEIFDIMKTMNDCPLITDKKWHIPKIDMAYFKGKLIITVDRSSHKIMRYAIERYIRDGKLTRMEHTELSE